MKGFGKLVFLFVLAVLVMFGPVVRVEAADGEQVANELSGWVIAAAWVVAGVGLALLLAVIIAVFPEIRERVKQLLVKADSNPFWNTVPGRAFNDLLRQVQPHVDESTDPFIMRLQHMKFLNQLRQWGVLQGDDFSKIMAKLMEDAIKVTNGVPDVEFKLLDYDSTLGGSARAHAEALRLGTEPSGMGQFPNG